jgi:hypothetical protein
VVIFIQARRAKPCDENDPVKPESDYRTKNNQPESHFLLSFVFVE